MPYSFRKTLKEGYFHVRITGDNNASTIRRYLDDSLEACAEEKRVNILIEESLEGPRLRIGEIFQIISEKVGAVRGAVKLMVFVDAHAGRDAANLEFGERVSRNRGMTVKAFETVEAAETWIREAVSKGNPQSLP